MVLGRINVEHHYVDFIFNKEKYEVKCTCSWKVLVPKRSEAISSAYQHLADMSAERDV